MAPTKKLQFKTPAKIILGLHIHKKRKAERMKVAEIRLAQDANFSNGIWTGSLQ